MQLLLGWDWYSDVGSGKVLNNSIFELSAKFSMLSAPGKSIGSGFQLGKEILHFVNCPVTFTATIQETAERRVQSKMVSQARLIKDWVVLDILRFKVREFFLVREHPIRSEQSRGRLTSSTS